ncbi:GNAT family N-acetyltransferase [Bowmanella denitrificans]|nr:GNAT family N-acetyltransferase [Bowmanella denitrificans]
MQLSKATPDCLAEISQWFDSEDSLKIWGGPAMQYPFDLQSLRRDTRIDELPSWLLMENNQLLGFGQYYLREGRCHLGRLVIAPEQRGRGLAKVLIQQLSRLGSQELQTCEVSLFVLAHNQVAHRCYLAMGFVEIQYPGPSMGIDNCLYMVAAADHISDTISQPSKGNETSGFLV